MKKPMLAMCVALGLMAVPAAAQDSGTTYDWRTGNTYNWSTDYSGNTRVRGYNLNTGSTWNQTIKPNGDQNGFDSQGNYWNYNARSKSYYNYGTGKSCVNGFCNSPSSSPSMKLADVMLRALLVLIDPAHADDCHPRPVPR